jgi:hypothetical protein
MILLVVLIVIPQIVALLVGFLGSRMFSRRWYRALIAFGMTWLSGLLMGVLAGYVMDTGIARDLWQHEQSFLRNGIIFLANALIHNAWIGLLTAAGVSIMVLFDEGLRRRTDRTQQLAEPPSGKGREVVARGCLGGVLGGVLGPVLGCAVGYTYAFNFGSGGGGGGGGFAILGGLVWGGLIRLFVGVFLGGFFGVMAADWGDGKRTPADQGREDGSSQGNRT